MLGGCNRPFEGRRVVDPVLFEQVLSDREKLDGAVDRNPELLAAPRPHRPDGGVKIERRKRCGLDVTVERDDEALLHRLAEPGGVDGDDVVLGFLELRILDQPIVELRQLPEVEALPRRDIVAEIGPHISHRYEVIIVVEQEPDLVFAAEQALDQAWRRNDLRREIGSAEIVILIAVALGPKTECLGQQKLDSARVLHKAVRQRVAWKKLEPLTRVAEGFGFDMAALDQRVDPAHRGGVGNVGDGGKRGKRHRRSRQVALDQEQEHVPRRVFLGDRNHFLERLSNALQERDDPQEFVLGHPNAIRPLST